MALQILGLILVGIGVAMLPVLLVVAVGWAMGDNSD